jgi:hypothetical protein
MVRRVLGARTIALAVSAILLLASLGPEEARAQRPVGDEVDQKSWAGLMTGGYSTAMGDAFGGGSSVGLTAGLYRMRSPTFKLGFEVGYDRLGGYTNTFVDIRGPGSSQIEEFDWSVLHLAAVARFQPDRSSIRPVGIVGFGAYTIRTRDNIEAFDVNGAPMPAFDFLDTRSSIRPGGTVGLGVELPHSSGRWTVGAEARLHSVFDLALGGVAMANFATIAVSVGFD